jgi:uncharacterized cupredoxin-like copper-binding protein
MKALRSTAVGGALIAASLCVVHAGSAVGQISWSTAHPVQVEMIDYEFVPSELRFRHGLPYRLHLRNAGHDGHDFTAPAFFASVTLKESAALNERRTSVFLAPGQQTDIYFVAATPGVFDLRCADHDWDGMTAKIIVD